MSHFLETDKIPLTRCLVTGANGFIGRALCKTLKEQGIFVRALVRKENTDLICDKICIGNLLWSDPNIGGLTPDIMIPDIDTIFHLAGIAHAQNHRTFIKKDYWQINVEATEKLLDLAHHQGVKRFIYFSSVKASNDPKDHYGASKKKAEESVLFLGKKYGIDVVILRPALVYGPKVKGNLALMIKGIQQGWFPVLPNIQNKRSLVSLQDLVEVAILVAKSPQTFGKIYTITDGRSYSSREIYDAMRKACGKPPARFALPYRLFQCLAKLCDIVEQLFPLDMPFNSDKLDKLLGSAFYPCQNIQQDLGWQPKDNFHKVIQQMVS